MACRVVVVGAGIAGLSAAKSLADSGCRVVVLESAHELGEIGAGLAVTVNGMASAEVLGVADHVRGGGWPGALRGYDDHRGRRIMQLPVAAKTSVVGIHRRALHATLLEALPSEVEVRTSCQMVSLEAGDASVEGATVHYLGGGSESAEDADLVVAADGVWSSARAQLFPGHPPSYSGRTCWRGIVEDPALARLLGDGFAPVLGPAAEFGALRISETQTYWYGYVRAPKGEGLDDELAVATRYFASWGGEVPRIVGATQPDHLVRHDVYSLRRKLPTYVAGRVVLIGDAAHAVVPTMGQGANTALEDGASLGPVVGSVLADGLDLRSALAAFDQHRRPRTQRIARESEQLDAVGSGLRHPAAMALRSAVFRHLPVGLAMKQRGWLLEWAVPEAVTAGS